MPKKFLKDKNREGRRKTRRQQDNTCWEKGKEENTEDTADPVDEPMLRRERVAMVREAMQTLSDDHRSILVHA